MNRFFLLLCLIGVVTIGCGACGYAADKNTDKESMPVDYSQKILFVFRDTAYSNGFQNQGYFIMGDGLKYYYNLSQEDRKYAEIEVLYQYLLSHSSEFEQEEYLLPEDIKECVEFLYDVDSKAEIKKELVYFGGGEAELFGIRYVNSTPEFILLKGQGSVEKELEDEKAERIIEILGEEWFNTSH